MDLNTPASEVAATLPALTPEAVITLIEGVALVALGTTMILRVPQARELCGRVARNEGVQKAGREVASFIIRGASQALGL